MAPLAVSWSAGDLAPIGYRIELPSGEEFVYLVEPETTSFVFPPEAQRHGWERKDFQITIVALFSDGEQIVNGMALTVE